MKKLCPVLFLFFTMIACKNEKKIDETSSTQSETAALEIGCYTYENQGDTIIMKINSAKDSVRGTLDVSYAEKDANSGTFTGYLKENELMAIYTFNSEGKESKREIAFLVEDDQLIEGYGDMNAEGTKFKDSKSITYSSKMPLSKEECKN
ncbi:MAG: hypothetical protein WA951_06705 [Leeuwenhoekiella sp.]